MPVLTTTYMMSEHISLTTMEILAIIWLMGLGVIIIGAVVGIIKQIKKNKKKDKENKDE